MNKIVALLLLVGSITTFAQSTWKVDKAHSKVSFNITHLMISEVTGNFGDFDIEATADDAFADPSFTVEIKTASVDTDNERRDNHLRSDDFFGVEKFPSMSFKTTTVEKTGEKTFKLIGELTIRGITNSVTLNGKVNGVITNKRNEKLKAGIKITGVIDRLAFKVGEGFAALGDEVEMTINMEMNQQ